MTRYLDNFPNPWSQQQIEAAIMHNFTDARSAIEDTEGARLWFELNDLSDSCWILDTSTQELLDLICIFGNHSKNLSFWNEANREAQNQYARRVKKKIFICTSALMALVDHARNFQKKYPLSKFSDQRLKYFGLNGLHEFLQGLRNYNSHWRIAKADWEINYKFGEGHGRTAQFVLHKSDLLRWDGWSKKPHEFIAASPDKIDVANLFSSYNNKAQAFYTWHKGAIIDKYAKILQKYFTYKRHHDSCHKRLTWNMIISHYRGSDNPYEYIDRYLSKEEIEHLLSYEYKSPAQIDKLIEMVDRIGACDEALKEKVRSLLVKKV